MGGHGDDRNSLEWGMRNGECGLRPVGAIGAYAPEGMQKKKMKSTGEGGLGERVITFTRFPKITLKEAVELAPKAKINVRNARQPALMPER
jgi:hypothetical protein